MAVIHQSDLSSFNRCAMQFAFSRAGQPRKTTSALAYGSVMHYAFEVFERLRHQGTPHAEAVQAARETFRHYWHPMNIEAICEPVDLWLPRQGYSELLSRGLTAIDQYCDLIRDDDHELLATEFSFRVPIDGTWDYDLGEPHQLDGTIDRLAVRYYTRAMTVCVDDYKCCELGTPILMADGTERAVETVRVGDMVAGWVDGVMTPVAVEASRDNFEQPCVRVRSTYGDLVVTTDHPFLVGREWMKAGDLQAGDLLTVALGTASEAASSPEAIQEAWALGVLVGDGYLGDHMKITQGDEKVIEGLRQALPGAITGPSGRGTDYGMSNRLKPWLASHELLGCRSREKHIPAAILAGGPDVWAAFLAGWFDTDGHARLRPTANVSWSTVSERLARQGQRLLLNLGVMATVAKIVSTYAGNPHISYQLKVANAYGASRLRDLLPVRGRKAVRLAEVPNIPVMPGPRNRWPAYGQDHVLSVEAVGSRPTWALTVEGGVHVTGNIVTHNTGKEYRYLRQNLQFSAYCYATTKREFWVGNKGEEGFGPERGEQLYQRFLDAPRRGTWINLKTIKFQDAGWRGPDDYSRFALAVEQVIASMKAEIYPLNLSGDVCQYCEYREICPPNGVPTSDHGAPRKR